VQDGCPLAPPCSIVPLAPSCLGTPLLCPSGSIRLFHPFVSTLVLCCSGSTVVFRIQASALFAGAISSTSALWILLVTAHCTMAEGELSVDLGLLEVEGVSQMPAHSSRYRFLHRCRLAASLLTLSPPSVGSPWVCQIPLSLPSASLSRTLPQPVNPAGPPWLLALSAVARLSTGSTVCVVPPAPSGSSIPSAPPCHQIYLGPPDPPHDPGSPSPPWAPPPLALPLSVALPPPGLLPPSAPPWVAYQDVAWVPPGSSYFKSLPPLPWLLPPSSPPWTSSAGPLPGVCPPP
ncbi:hypothetical protein M9458_028310, partial [Cirrhinus mrigala]